MKLPSDDSDMGNLVLLCAHHRRLLLELGYTITTANHGVFGFHRPDGTRIDPAPAQTGQHRLDRLRTACTPQR